jgi:hypothetical protein
VIFLFTTVHQYFSKTYGTPHDVHLRQYIFHESPIHDALQALKASFLRVHLQRLGVVDSAAIESRIDKTQLAQLFLTVQPCASEMLKLDTHLLPHFDPSDLTINLHFSDSEFHGAKRDENGLLIFDKQVQGEEQVVSDLVHTPQGTAVFIWKDESGDHKCLHTANKLSCGSRVVLCSFWRFDPQNVDEKRALHSFPPFITPRPLPVNASGKLSSQAKFVALVDGAVLVDGTSTFLSHAVLDWLMRESRAIFSKGGDSLSGCNRQVM